MSAIFFGALKERCHLPRDKIKRRAIDSCLVKKLRASSPSKRSNVLLNYCIVLVHNCGYHAQGIGLWFGMEDSNSFQPVPLLLI